MSDTTTRRPHPLRQLIAPLTLDSIETWQECNALCGLGFKVVMSNGSGDTRTQSGFIGMFPQATDFQGWRNVWLMINNQLEWYATELEMLTILRQLPKSEWCAIADVESYDHRFMGNYAISVTGRVMQSLSGYKWQVVQYLCKQECYANT